MTQFGGNLTNIISSLPNLTKFPEAIKKPEKCQSQNINKLKIGEDDLSIRETLANQVRKEMASQNLNLDAKKDGKGANYY